MHVKVPSQLSRKQSLAGLLLACAYAGVVSAAAPFTIAADVLVALPIGVMALVLTGQLWRRSHLSNDHLPELRTREWILWPMALALLLAWELVSFFASPRSAHPTLSSLYDTLAHWEAAKAAVCLAWLGVGWYLVRLPLPTRRNQ